jgi:hypothetical protein
VAFGPDDATAIEADDEASLIATAPIEKPRTVQVTVTTAVGTSGQSEESRFEFVPDGATLELGRCLKVAKHEIGAFAKSSCTEPSSAGKYDWSTELLKPGFKLATKGATQFETAGGVVVECKGAGSGSGEFVAPRSVTAVTVAFTGCGFGKGKRAVPCASPGAAAGELRTSVLEGAIGFDSIEKADAALDLLPAVEGEPFVTFTCGKVTTVIRGAVLGSMGALNKATATFKLGYSSAKGKQHIRGFEGGPTETLEASVEGGPFEAAGLAAGLTINNEEAIEINTVV